MGGNCWIPTGGEDFFVLFRLYGPQQAFFDRTWTLADVEVVPEAVLTR
jgi:hypothetical protein